MTYSENLNDQYGRFFNRIGILGIYPTTYATESWIHYTRAAYAGRYFIAQGYDRDEFNLRLGIIMLLTLPATLATMSAASLIALIGMSTMPFSYGVATVMDSDLRFT